MPQLPHPSQRLYPPEDLFHVLAPVLTDRISSMPRGPAVNRTLAPLIVAPRAVSHAGFVPRPQSPWCRILCPPLVGLQESFPSSPAPRPAPPCHALGALPLRSPSRCGSPSAHARYNSAWPLCRRPSWPAEHPRPWSTEAYDCCASPRENPPWGCRDHLAAAPVPRPSF